MRETKRESLDGSWKRGESLLLDAENVETLGFESAKDYQEKKMISPALREIHSI